MLASLLDVGHLVQVAGYPLLFLLVMAESSGIPVPGETALITASVLVVSSSARTGIQPTRATTRRPIELLRTAVLLMPEPLCKGACHLDARWRGGLGL